MHGSERCGKSAVVQHASTHRCCTDLRGCAAIKSGVGPVALASVAQRKGFGVALLYTRVTVESLTHGVRAFSFAVDASSHVTIACPSETSAHADEYIYIYETAFFDEICERAYLYVHHFPEPLGASMVTNSQPSPTASFSGTSRSSKSQPVDPEPCRQRTRIVIAKEGVWGAVKVFF